MSGVGATPRQAMVLAAGFGVRMRPLSNARAKSSLPFMNRPLIWHALALLHRHGVGVAAVNLHHEAESLVGALEGSIPEGMTIHLSREASIRGTAGGLQAARQYLDPAQPLLVVNGDSVSDTDLEALGRAHARAASRDGAPVTLAVTSWAPGDPYNPVHLDAEDRLTGIGGEGAAGRPHTFMGVSLLSPEALRRIPAEGRTGLVRDLYIPLLREGARLGAYRHPGLWVELGSPRLYLQAHMKALSHERFVSLLPSEAGKLDAARGGSLLGPGWDGDGAAVERIVAGPGARVLEGAEVRGSVLGRDVTIGKGARVVASVIWDGVRVGEGERVEGALLMREEGGSGSVSRTALG